MTTVTTASLDKFRQVYADAVIRDMTDEQCKVAVKERQLHWHGERITLAEAAEIYATICQGYNEFKPNMLKRLLVVCPDVGIEVTPAREGSVAVYLHIPTGRQQKSVEAWVKKMLNADEVDVVDHFTCLQDGEEELDGEALRIWWD